MMESSESADAAHQNNLSEKTSEADKAQCSEVSEENDMSPYMGNYYSAPYIHYSTANNVQWPFGDTNGFQYASTYFPCRGFEGYDWYSADYRQGWNTPDNSNQAYAPFENYYYVDGYAAANGSSEGGTTEDLEQSFNQLSLEGYTPSYKNQFGGWNAMTSPAFVQYGNNRLGDYSQFQNKSKLLSWDGSRENFYRNGGSVRYWGLGKDQNKKLSDKQPGKDSVQDAPSSSCQMNPSQSMYNQKDFDLDLNGARYFVIKSYSEDDIHRSIKFGIWCSTEYGNKRLDAAYREREGKGKIYLFFSVNGSGHFCGVAMMTSPLDYNANPSIWAQNKWKGKFEVRWIYVKDVPNSQLRHIKLENNENKPVTNSRDTQEVPADKGKQVLHVIHQYLHTTSIFDDFQHYEQRLLEDNKVKPTG